MTDNNNVYHVHEECERHENSDAECQLLSRVWRSLETKDDHAGDHNAGDDQVVEVVDCLALNTDLKGDINVGLR